MAPLAVFGIENDGLNLTVNLLLLFLVVVWLALVYWTYADARRRIVDPMLVGCATAASFFPFVGTVIYLIVRPPETLEDRHERELEVAAAESRLASADHQGCPYCGFEIERSFLRCPSCLRRLKEPCAVCGKPLDPSWKLCPYCEAEVGEPPSEQRARPRRAASQRQGAGPGGARPTQPRRTAQSGQRPPARAAGAPGDGSGAGESPAPASGRPARPAERSSRPAERPARPADRPARPAERPARPAGERPARPSGERPGSGA
jgi:hypothetical protein